MGEPTAYHRILSRQLRRIGVSASDPPDCRMWEQLLTMVSTTYTEMERTRYVLQRSVEISSEEMRALVQALHDQARHDALTGLPNRAALGEYLTEELNRCRRTGDKIAVLFVDLDDFKLVNDVLGHSAGDNLLVLVANRICRAVREQNLVARLGGDEFVVVEAGTDLRAGTALASRVATAVKQPFHMADRRISVSASVGITIADPRSATIDGMLSEADIAMYQAKARRPGHFMVFNDRMRTEDRRAPRQATSNGPSAAFQ
jgi:diguanylate cyclase (GGDEF)-like protein